jgi:hypothetical protein
MTRKDYILIADALRSEKPNDGWDPNKRVQWDLDCKAIAQALAGDNPRFDREHFLAVVRGEKPLNSKPGRKAVL